MFHLESRSKVPSYRHWDCCMNNQKPDLPFQTNKDLKGRNEAEGGSVQMGKLVETHLRLERVF